MGMIRKLVAADVGRRLAGSGNGVKGALIGAAAPWLLRRAFTPVGMAIIGAIAAKKLYDASKARTRDQQKGFTGITRSAPAKELQ